MKTQSWPSQRWLLVDFREAGLLLDLSPDLAQTAWLSADEGFQEAIAEGPGGLLFDLVAVLKYGYQRLKRVHPRADGKRTGGDQQRRNRKKCVIPI